MHFVLSKGLPFYYDKTLKHSIFTAKFIVIVSLKLAIWLIKLYHAKAP